ncbi:DsbA family oxidoreductase [Actinophytocola oryzae]|uniref:Putative DsbA family dithiol-disulfide isomerase n=1 Tax=Actinophytocola oryzae TaxID=502181 RepID=A0A4R7UXL2_9PSEU|nr:DsbA family oxidoreductase [Actinophytocola oryzae]TDV39816.1 putative DsbA family dithiol-disulfide isomerase [Actinophytocola oryzae]
MKIEVWSDIVCPWCYIGKRRLESALAGFDHDVEVEWKSFQLDPEYPRGKAVPVYDALAEKFGGQIREMTQRVIELAEVEGLHYDYDHAVMVNTFDAHRLAHHAKSQGLGPEMHERLMRAQLVEGETLNDVDTLVRLAEEIGVEGAGPVVTSDKYTAEVEADIQEARLLGANGVPFFVLDRKYGVSGAQPVEVFEQALRTAHENA